MPILFQYFSPGAHLVAMKTLLTSVKGFVEIYMRDPLNEPLTNHQQEIKLFIKVADDSTRKSQLLTTVDGNENPYHTAVRHQNIKVIKLINELYLDGKSEELLQMNKRIELSDRLRGSVLTFLTSQCVTPIHIAVKLWREKDVGKERYEALMDGLPPRPQLEALKAPDEKGREALLVASEAKNIDRRRAIEDKLILDLHNARKNIDGKWSFFAVLLTKVSDVKYLEHK